jgi:hypothetical protein
MNYAIFSQWVQDRVEELVSFGVSRAEAENLMRGVEFGAIADEAENRSDDQFLLDFKRVGSRALAERGGVTEQAIRKRRTRILRNRTLRAQLR